MNSVKGAMKSVTMQINVMLLLIYQYADQIIQATHDYLPDLAQYLPENIYKGVGLAVVGFNIYRRSVTSQSLSEKGKA